MLVCAWQNQMQVDSRVVADCLAGDKQGCATGWRLVNDIRWLGAIVFTHVYREANKCADALANHAFEM